MNIIDKLERSKFGRFGIPNLMKYVIALNAVGLLLGLINPGFYYRYLSLDMYAIFHGQIWRLFTFLVCPSIGVGTGNGLVNLFWFLIWAQVYYSIGNHLERLWGTFRFNLFYISGLLWIVLVSVVFYLFLMTGDSSVNSFLGTQMGVVVNLTYLNQTLFLAFALLYPDMQFLIYFVIPVKAKWLSVLYLGLTGYELFEAIRGGSYYMAALIAASLVNLVLFLILARVKESPRETIRKKKRQVEFQYKARPQTMGPRHRCVICGRTDIDAPDLEFRYCSKCEGNFEYCSEHLFTHEHVHHD